MANKLELTWYGKDEPIRVEPRLLIENTALSNTAEMARRRECLLLGYGRSLLRSLMTSPARMSPATAGTKALLPGMSRRSVQWRWVPGGQMQWDRQLMDISSRGRIGSSSE